MDKKTAGDIDREIEKIRADLIKIRRFIHMNPRLPGDESETAKLISGRLQSLGLEVRNGSGRAGVVGLLRGNLPGAWIALRAGLEADPVQETADVPFKSLNPGIMHASGRDIQATIALGAALVLSSFKDQLRGGVKFIFQPGTPESAGTDEGGAALMIKEGVLDNPPVVAVFGLGLSTDVQGQAFLAPGPFLASSDSFHVLVRGRPAASSSPEGADAVVLAAHIITALQTLVDRITDPADPALVSIGRIEGGNRPDTVADRVAFDGVLRTLNESSRKRLPRAMETLAKGIAQALGGDATFSFEPEIPAVYNHPELLAMMRPTFDEALGENKLVEIKPQMASDDFGRYAQRASSLYFLLGSRNPRLGPLAPLHSPGFNPDERTITIGIKLMVHMLLDCLERQGQNAAVPR
ncbi:MAG: M20 family metallopeptidase [Candidatus Aminicenantes bacterium]|nr:M20 family metallopeptidase [Candidatus Aminicenantes bacterium]